MSARWAAWQDKWRQGLACDTMAFALPRGVSDTGFVGAVSSTQSLTLRYTFPLTWPGPFGAGLFFGKACAFGARQEKTFPTPMIVVESRTITTNDRGISCGKYLSPCFWQFLCLAACRTIFSAGWLALVLVRRLPISRAAISMLARLWAVCSALCATILTCAGAKPHLGAVYINARPNGHFARLAFLHFCQGHWPAFGAERELADV
jgi:hypothetical protein